MEAFFYGRSMIPVLTSSLVFILGAVFGSFANVVVFRYGKESFVWPRSRCSKCKNLIAWYDNIPLLSWMLLRARCRSCQQSISWQYPAVEFTVALIALIIFHRFAFSPTAFVSFSAIFILLIIGLIDLHYFVIPLGAILILLLLSLATSIYQYWEWERYFPGPATWSHFAFWGWPKFIGMVGGFLFMASLLVIFTFLARAAGRIDKGQLAMGWGDPILVGSIGALLGWRFLPWAIAIGCLQGLLIALIFQKFFAAHRKRQNEDGDLPEYSVPLGSFICLGTMELILFWPSAIL